MNIEQQLKQLLKWGEGETFYCFANADGKRWWMPVRHMAIAMNLYQPSGVKGKLLKQGLPWLHWNPIVRKVLHTERLQLKLGDELKELLERVFGQQDLEFAIFGGTPCVHQKITIQVSQKERILGYVKVTESEDIYQIFDHEQQILDMLHCRGISQIPNCLYCGTLKNGLHLFVQSTIKTKHSEVLHVWNENHELFLNNLVVCTRREIYFEESDFYSDLNKLKECLPVLGNPSVIIKTIQEVREKYAGKRVVFSAFQADFTPWNMFVEKGQLFVFDWEYARMTYPARLDYFHFLMQTAIFEEHLSVDEIFSRYHSQRIALTKIWNDPDIALKCYLLAIISIYMQREHGELEANTIKRIGLWLNLLRKLENVQ